jgi:hypothetical protein
VRNVGSGAANVTDIYVDGVHCTMTPAFAYMNNGQVQTFTVTTSALATNQAHTFKAATSNGGENTYTAAYG